MTTAAACHAEPARHLAGRGQPTESDTLRAPAADVADRLQTTPPQMPPYVGMTHALSLSCRAREASGGAGQPTHT